MEALLIQAFQTLLPALSGWLTERVTAVTKNIKIVQLAKNNRLAVRTLAGVVGIVSTLLLATIGEATLDVELIENTFGLALNGLLAFLVSLAINHLKRKPTLSPEVNGQVDHEIELTEFTETY